MQHHKTTTKQIPPGGSTMLMLLWTQFDYNQTTTKFHKTLQPHFRIIGHSTQKTTIVSFYSIQFYIDFFRLAKASANCTQKKRRRTVKTASGLSSKDNLFQPFCCKTVYYKVFFIDSLLYASNEYLVPTVRAPL